MVEISYHNQRNSAIRQLPNDMSQKTPFSRSFQDAQRPIGERRGQKTVCLTIGRYWNKTC
jgi:hypothetical protein